MKTHMKYRWVLPALLAGCMVFGSAGSVLGAESGYYQGKSLAAADQVMAGGGYSWPGLDITWLDLGNDISSVQVNSSLSDGVFSIGAAHSDGEWENIVVDWKGTVIGSGYTIFERFSDGVALVGKVVPSDDPAYRGPIGSGIINYTYIDHNGKEIMPFRTHPSFFRLEEMGFHDGLALYFEKREIGEGAFAMDGGYIDKTGEVVIPADSAFVRYAFSEGLAMVMNQSTELYGFIDKTGHLAIPCQYRLAANFHDGEASVIKGSENLRIGKDGIEIPAKRIENSEFTLVDEFKGGIAPVRDLNGKYGYIKEDGSVLIQPQYDMAYQFQSGMAWVEKYNEVYDARTGFLINENGERLTPLWHYLLDNTAAKDGLQYVKSLDNAQKTGVLNRYGAEVVPPMFDVVSEISEGVCIVMPDRDKNIAGILKLPEDVHTRKDGQLIKVYIDDQRLDIADTDPVILNDRTMVPLRVIFEALGAEVDWDAETKTAIATGGGISISIALGAAEALVDGVSVALDAPAFIKNSRTMVPLRFVAESLKAEVKWEAESRTVRITR